MLSYLFLFPVRPKGARRSSPCAGRGRVLLETDSAAVKRMLCLFLSAPAELKVELPGAVD